MQRFDAPSIDEAAVLQQRNDELTKIAKTHQRFEALQYPIIFWDGADGYHFNVKTKNPIGGKEIIRMNHYNEKLFIPINDSRE